MDLEAQLHAGNSRSNRDLIANWIGDDPARFRQLMRVYLKGDIRESQLAAGVLFSCLEFQPELIGPWIPEIVKRMSEEDLHPAVRRVAVRILMELETPRPLQGRVLDLCLRYLADPSEPIAIRVFAMGTAAKIAEAEPDVWSELLQTVQMVIPYSTPAFKAHARKVAKRARKYSPPSRNSPN